MTVEIKFEAGQEYQLEAIDAVTSLLSGWNAKLAQSSDAIELSEDNSLFSVSHTVFGNEWGIDNDDLLANVRQVQSRTRTNDVGERVAIVPEAARISQGHVENLRDFSIEMETGTGKTYVYLRTAVELFLKFGIAKFVIVVPSVAIREGVVASLSLMKQHFREIYAGVQYDSYVYDSKNVNRLRQFATAKHLQILVMNIQAFNKDSNIIMREADGLQGMKPIDFITSVKPIVIMDEPQKLDGPMQKLAIEGLNPLFRLRYSATHKDVHCMLYKLGPVDAYERKLVKRIEVLSLSAEEDLNSAFVHLLKVNVSSGAPTATVIVNTHNQRVQKTIRKDDDLATITGMKVYQGWLVEDIRAATEGQPAHLQFGNGRLLQANENTDVEKAWWQRAQMRAAITGHLETELRLRSAARNGEIQPIKPLTLFFIDQVANYDPEDGPFKLWFDELWEEILRDNRQFRNLDLPENGADVRAGYFATTKGKAKDTNGDSADDAAAYDLIMRNKEQLLSPEEPVRFIFSHSALSEGWDNPNVFTICNMQDGKSTMRRRQQIGRGLRLPVMANGERNRNHAYNILTIIASESFEKYASALQKEIEDETGESFAGKIQEARKRKSLQLKADYRTIPGFSELWAKIAPKTRYQLQFNSEDLIDEAAKRLIDLGRKEPIRVPRIIVKRFDLEMAKGRNIEAGKASPEKYLEYARRQKMPDVLGELQQILPISRATVVKIIEKSGRMVEAPINPAKFVQQVRRSVQHAMAHTLVDHRGIKYERIAGVNSEYSAEIFEGRLVEAYADNLVPVTKSIYDYVICDSNIEREYAAGLEKRPDIELFIKLPDWFKIDTPIGGYNPDWAIVRKLENDDKKVYLVRETKGTTDISSLRFEGEGWKIEFGSRHFEAIDVDYNITSHISQLDFDIPLHMNFDEEADEGVESSEDES
jgi:type III restriction enzyme